MRCWSSLLDERPTLICFPPVPYTGIFFDTFAKQMECEVVCPDLPGYGQSDSLSSDPTIEKYVERLNICLNHSESEELDFDLNLLVNDNKQYTLDKKWSLKKIT